MAKHRNFLSEKSDVLLFPVENLPKTSVPGVRYFRPVCRLLPSEALPGAFQNGLQQLMNVNFEALKILHTHCTWLIPKPQSVEDHRHLNTKTPHPGSYRMGSFLCPNACGPLHFAALESAKHNECAIF